jgi:nitrite reductase (NO-forming)
MPTTGRGRAARVASPAVPSMPRGVEGRVVAVQRQARASLLLAGAFAVAALVTIGVPHRTGRWLPLHLFLAGALLLAISGASQLFAVTWAAGPAPPARVATVQRVLLAVGVAGLALGRELRGPDALIGIAGGAVIAALALLAVALWRTVIGGVQRRFDPSLRFYLTAVSAGVIACGLGVALALGLGGDAKVRVRDVHVTLNLLGLVGLVIAGTLPFFSATEARVKMSPRATSRAQCALLAWLAVALSIGAAGMLADAHAIAAAGLLAYAAGLVGIVALLPRVGRKQLRWAGPRLLQLATGIAWWAGAVVAAAWRAAHGAAPFDGPVLLVLVVGGYAQVLAASLAYLGPVLRGGGHERLRAGFRGTRSWVGLVAANGAAVAVALDAGPVAVVAVAAWAVDTVVRAVALLAPSLGARIAPEANAGGGGAR